MPQLATITSKRQLTIPAQIFKQTGLHQGQKVLILREGNNLRIKPAVKAVERLAGSVKIPANFKGLTVDQIITRAKAKHFKA